MRDGAIEAEEGAPTIEAEAARLERLVRDLLDVARMNRSEFHVERNSIDLARVAREAARRYRPQAETFGITLELDTTAARLPSATRNARYRSRRTSSRTRSA